LTIIVPDYDKNRHCFFFISLELEHNLKVININGWILGWYKKKSIRTCEFTINHPLVLFEKSNCIDWINFCNISGTHHTFYLLSFVKLLNPDRFLLTKKYQKRQSKDNCLILLFNSKYKHRWIKCDLSAG
jgi:hypothetical protein